MVERSSRTAYLRCLWMILVASLMLALAASATPLFAERALAAASGTTGNCTWELDDEGTLTIAPIEGTDGKMEDYSFRKETPWDSHRYNVLRVVAEPGVTSIGDRAFYFCSYLTEVSLPSTLTSIGDDAFCSCDSLTGATIPEGVTSIGDGAFRYASLTEVSLPSTLASIGNDAFYMCDYLTEVVIPEDVVFIGSHVFAGCDNLASIVVESGNASYSSLDGVLFSADGSTLISYPGGGPRTYAVPEGVTTISGAFYWCGSLTEVSLPSTLASIGGYAFTGCDSLASIVVESGNASYSSLDGVLFSADGDTLVYYPEGGARAYSVPEGVVSLGDGAFYSCDSLTEVSLPSTLASVGDDAFFGCESLTEVTIPEGVTSIGSFAFGWCDSLTEVTVPKSVTSIGNYAFTSLPEGSVITVSTQSQYNLLTGNNADRYIEVGSTTVVLSGGAKDIAQAEFSAIDDQLYTGGELTPKVVVAYEGETLREERDYTVSYDNNVEAGQASLVVSGRGYFAGCKTIEFDILPVNMGNVLVGSIAVQTYTGSAVEPPLSLSFDGRALVEGIDYEVSYLDNFGPGSATAIVTGIGNFEGEAVVSFEIIPAVINGVPSAIAGLTYSGSEQVGVFGIDAKGIEASGVTSATDAGDYVAVATPLYGYEWSDGSDSPVEVGWSIAPADISSASIAKIPPRGYTGSAIEPDLTLTFNGMRLVENVDYEVSYSGNVEAGTATATVTGIGNFEGSASTTFRIVKATGEYALLKEHIQSEGLRDSRGNRFIEYSCTVFDDGEVIDATATITYLDEGAQFEFFYVQGRGSDVSKTVILIEEDGSETVTAGFETGVGVYAVRAASSFEAAEYEYGGRVRFKETVDNRYLAEDQIQDLCNTHLEAAFISWEILLYQQFRLEVGMSDLGFSSYEVPSSNVAINVTGKGTARGNAIEVIPGLQYSNTWSSSGNNNPLWNEVILEGDGYIYVTATSAPFSVDFFLYDGDGNELFDAGEINKDSGNGSFYCGLRAGTYYLKLSNRVSSASVGYSVSIVEGVPCEKEPNETFAAATPIELDREYLGFYSRISSWSSSVDKDYYSVDLIAGTAYKLLIGGWEEIGRTSFSLYEPDRASYTYLSDTSGRLRYDDSLGKYVYEFICNKTGTYYVYASISQGEQYSVEVQTCAWKSFSDTPANAWYVTNGTLDYVIANGIMSGTSSTTFEPGGKVTRAQVATILYNLTGRPAVGEAEAFSDVEAGSWYHDAVMWARSAGVVSGYDDGSFKPGVSVTREQLACMLRNYAGNVAGLDVAVGADGLDGFADAASVSPWARDSVAWCVGRGIIAGTPSGGSVFVNPEGTAVRAEAAQMVRAFDEKVLGA